MIANFRPDTDTPREIFQSFDKETRSPSKVLPPLSCDGQIHVFGPAEHYPVRSNAVFEAPEATLAAATAMHDKIGIERCVIVQSAVYGTDNRCMVDALRIGGARYRGCAMIDEHITDKELQHLHDVGVRGVRFNFFRGVNLVFDPSGFKRVVEKTAAMGWYAKLHPMTGFFHEPLELFDKLDLPVLVDHYGRPEAPSIYDDTVKTLTNLVDRGNWWVMMSNPHRFSLKPDWSDMVPVMRELIDAAPSRMIWASDWPHPLSRSKVPNDGDLIDFLIRNTSDAELEAILVDNPAALFGFEPLSDGIPPATKALS